MVLLHQHFWHKNHVSESEHYMTYQWLRTSNEGINQRNLGWCGRQNMLRSYLKILEWEWIFGHAVKAIFSLGVRSPWSKVTISEFIHFINIIVLLPVHYSLLSSTDIGAKPPGGCDRGWRRQRVGGVRAYVGGHGHGRRQPVAVAAAAPAGCRCSG